MGRRRPSGPGGNSARFATISAPDGKEFKVPVARDAATMFCLEENGDWPKRGSTLLAYDVTWALPGKVLTIVEGRTGKGMGDRIKVRVIKSQEELVIHDGNWGQIRRWVLVERIEDALELTADDLLSEDLN